MEWTYGSESCVDISVRNGRKGFSDLWPLSMASDTKAKARKMT